MQYWSLVFPLIYSFEPKFAIYVFQKTGCINASSDVGSVKAAMS